MREFRAFGSRLLEEAIACNNWAAAPVFPRTRLPMARAKIKNRVHKFRKNIFAIY